MSIRLALTLAAVVSSILLALAAARAVINRRRHRRRVAELAELQKTWLDGYGRLRNGDGFRVVLRGQDWASVRGVEVHTNTPATVAMAAPPAPPGVVAGFNELAQRFCPVCGHDRRERPPLRLNCAGCRRWAEKTGPAVADKKPHSWLADSFKPGALPRRNGSLKL
jgi:hypothetical protein